MNIKKNNSRVCASSFSGDPAGEATKIADALSDFLDWTSKQDDISDYLDEYDLEHIGKAMDALYDFAHLQVSPWRR